MSSTFFFSEDMKWVIDRKTLALDLHHACQWLIKEFQRNNGKLLREVLYFQDSDKMEEKT